jgi:hypothetical protein
MGKSGRTRLASEVVTGDKLIKKRNDYSLARERVVMVVKKFRYWNQTRLEFLSNEIKEI